jgi:hypothetical protein
MTGDDEEATTADAWGQLIGVSFDFDAIGSIRRTSEGYPAVEVHSARIARRTGPSGRETRELFVEVTQQRYGYFDPGRQAEADDDADIAGKGHDFIMRGGSTLVIDLTDGSLRYAIRKRIDDEKRLETLRQWFLSVRETSLAATYFGPDAGREPFAMAHRS